MVKFKNLDKLIKEDIIPTKMIGASKKREGT